MASSSRAALHPASALALLLLAVHWLPPPPAAAATTRNGIRLCGSKLANALAIMCAGRGFHTIISKRSRSPFSNKHAASRYLRTVSKAKRASGGNGIVQECCRNYCSFSTLESYCARPSDSDIPVTNSMIEQLFPEGFLGEKAIDQVPPTIAAVVVPQLGASRNNEVDNGQDTQKYPAVPLTLGKSDSDTAPEQDEQDDKHGRIGSFTYSRENPFHYVWASGFRGDTISGENLYE